MHRWTAGFLLLVMLVPLGGPLALARTAGLEASHCMRRPLQQAAEPDASAMPCHHQMAPGPQPASPTASLSAVDLCCQNHDCCRSLKTSEWAHPASAPLSLVRLSIEPAPATPIANGVSADPTGQDSVRAPPRN